MLPMPRASVARAAAATALIVFALLLGALFRILSGSEHHAFGKGAVAPDSAHVTVGKTYTLSAAGGVKALQHRGIDVTRPQCEWSVNGSASQALTVTAAGPGTKAVNVVATFVAPYTGALHVDCLGWGPMFLDDAKGADPDYAGWLLLLATISLTVGIALGTASLRAVGAHSERAAREDDEIERLVHAVHVRSEDDEVPGSDAGDVIP
ncbi:MAG: hypothetical protein M3Y44_16990 [Actinomycetota bacterium]|nr:hypothetical protein [Actinomycetota bacterium]